MKKIEKYVTSDGAEFYNEEDALHREHLLDAIRRIESILPKRPDSSSFENGHGYVQHTRPHLEIAISWLKSLCLEDILSLSKYEFLKSYGFGRTLDDSGSILYSLYYRIILCIDHSTLREYGQPYFVNHLDETEQVEIR